VGSLPKREGVPIKVWLRKEDYELVKALAEKEGYSSVSDFLSELLPSCLRGPEEKTDIEALAKRLERVIVDLLNPYTAKIDEIYKRLGEIIELIESISQPQPAKEEILVQPRQKKVERPQPRKGLSAIERLRSEGVVFQEDMSWLKAPEKFFQKLEREGAIVIDVDGEKVAVDSSLWSSFKEALQQVMVRDPNEAASLIASAVGRPIVAKLFKKLVSSGLVYYDEEYGSWRLSEKLP
jgi:hypothetical protein